MEKTMERVSKLSTARCRRDISIRRLASQTGVDRTKISRWERGRCLSSIKQAIVVARALDTSVEELFD